MNIRKIRQTLRKEIGVSLRVYVRFKPKIKYEGSNCWGLYIEKPKSHTIEIVADMTPVQTFATLAHEYIHAWQIENGYRRARHNADKFPAWVRYFRQAYGVDIINMSIV